MRPPLSSPLDPAELALLARVAEGSQSRPMPKRFAVLSEEDHRALPRLLGRGLVAYRHGPCRAYLLCTLEGREVLESQPG